MKWFLLVLLMVSACNVANEGTSAYDCDIEATQEIYLSSSTVTVTVWGAEVDVEPGHYTVELCDREVFGSPGTAQSSADCSAPVVQLLDEGSVVECGQRTREDGAEWGERWRVAYVTAAE